MLVGWHPYIPGIRPCVTVRRRRLRTGLAQNDPSPKTYSQTSDNPWLRGLLQMSCRLFPVILVISHQKGTKFCYNRRTQAAEDPLVQQGRTIVFLPQVLLPRIFPQLSKRQSPRISYGPNVKKKGLLGPFLKPSTEKICLLTNVARTSLKSCKLYPVMSVNKTVFHGSMWKQKKKITVWGPSFYFILEKWRT